MHPAAEKVAPIMGEAELEELAAAEINRLHGEVGEGLRLTVEKTIRIGELLIEQKAKLAHGDWIPWIKANLTFPVRTAQRYVACWQNREKLNTSSTTHLTIEDLAHQSKPERKPGEDKQEKPAREEEEQQDIDLEEIAPKIFAKLSKAQREKFRWEHRKIVERKLIRI